MNSSPSPFSISNLPSNPLFSALVALYTLLFLYTPNILLRFAFSPAFISATFLVLTLARLGATQKGTPEETTSLTRTHSQHEKVGVGPPPPSIQFERGLDPNLHYRVSSGSFVEWDVGAPLEVIHESCCEGEEEEGEANEAVSCLPERKAEIRTRPENVILQRYPSLSKYYPETDSDSDSDSSGSLERYFAEFDGPEHSPGRMCCRWGGEVEEEEEEEEEEEGEREEREDGLIEIELGGGDKRKRPQQMEFDDFDEEENLIEIDISG